MMHALAFSTTAGGMSRKSSDVTNSASVRAYGFMQCSVSIDAHARRPGYVHGIEGILHVLRGYDVLPVLERDGSALLSQPGFDEAREFRGQIGGREWIFFVSGRIHDVHLVRLSRLVFCVDPHAYRLWHVLLDVVVDPRGDGVHERANRGIEIRFGFERLLVDLPM